MREALETTAAAQEKAAGTSRDMQMRVLNLGRAAQDLAQGGLGGIINNIEGIVGGGGIAAGVLTGLGTAALLATPYIKEYWKSLAGGGEKIPEAKDAMERYTEAINKNKKAIAELKEKEELTYSELLKYKQLVFDTTQLEEEQATKREARLVQSGSDKKSREQASAVRETIAERFGSSEELIRQIMGTQQGGQLGLKRVEEIMAGAQKGNTTDIRGLEGILPAFKEGYGQFSPEAKEAHKKALEGLKKEQEVQEQRLKKIERDNAEVERLNKEGIRATEQVNKLKERELSEGLKLARRVSEAAAKEVGRVNIPKATAPVQKIPHGASDMEIQQIMLKNQDALNQMLAEDRAE